MTPVTRTYLQELASLTLGQPVEDWITEHRVAGTRTWRQLVRDLREVSEGRIDVTIQTLQNWAPAAKNYGRADHRQKAPAA